MPSPKKNNRIYNVRMLELIEEAVRSGKVQYEMDFCEKIGYNNYNLPKIKTGDQGFKIEHIIKAAKFMDVSIDWICGLSKTRKPKGKDYSAVEMIEEGLKMMKKK
jgi:hypothetical protein